MIHITYQSVHGEPCVDPKRLASYINTIEVQFGSIFCNLFVQVAQGLFTIEVERRDNSEKKSGSHRMP